MVWVSYISYLIPNSKLIYEWVDYDIDINLIFDDIINVIEKRNIRFNDMIYLDKIELIEYPKLPFLKSSKKIKFVFRDRELKIKDFVIRNSLLFEILKKKLILFNDYVKSGRFLEKINDLKELNLLIEYIKKKAENSNLILNNVNVFIEKRDSIDKNLIEKILNDRLLILDLVYNLKEKNDTLYYKVFRELKYRKKQLFDLNILIDVNFSFDFNENKRKNDEIHFRLALEFVGKDKVNTNKTKKIELYTSSIWKL